MHTYRYAMGQHLHEAGYDAYITGHALLRLGHHILMEIQEAPVSVSFCILLHKGVSMCVCKCVCVYIHIYIYIYIYIRYSIPTVYVAQK
jgi:hypothetical protein